MCYARMLFGAEQCIMFIILYRAQVRGLCVTDGKLLKIQDTRIPKNRYNTVPCPI